jgi:hypothetical protein
MPAHRMPNNMNVPNSPTAASLSIFWFLDITLPPHLPIDGYIVDCKNNISGYDVSVLLHPYLPRIKEHRTHSIAQLQL